MHSPFQMESFGSHLETPPVSTPHDTSNPEPCCILSPTRAKFKCNINLSLRRY